MDYEFKDDENAPFGFRVEPCDKTSYEKTDICMHLDSAYVRMSIWVYSRCIHYLFNENRDFISWEQRAKEVESITSFESVFEEGYRVKRSREVVFGHDEHHDGREYIIDTLYQGKSFLKQNREIDNVPIEKVYEAYLEYKRSQHAFHTRRRDNQAVYLDSKTSHEQKIEIMYEEVATDVVLYAYHPMARDSDALTRLADYEVYAQSYFSRVDDKEEHYIEYLKAYCSGLRECAVEDLEAEEERAFIEQKCKKAGLENLFTCKS